jgi:hypothetical protein
MSVERSEDSIVETPAEEAPAKRGPVVVVAAVLVGVLLVGVAIGFAVGRMGDGGASRSGGSTEPTVTAKPPVSPPPSGGSRPTEPAASGSTLVTITAPPEATLAMIDAEKLAPDARYSIVFSPYGYGPPQGGKTLVIHISTATAENESAKAMDFAGKNMLAVITPGGADTAVGGTFNATLIFRMQGNALVPVVSDIRPGK